MCFHFCVLPCFPWLLPVLTIVRCAKRSNVSRTEITERNQPVAGWGAELGMTHRSASRCVFATC